MEKPIIEKAIRGTLKFLVFNRFYGFITRFDTREDIFVHGSEIRYINPMQFTRRCGDSVIFDLAVGVKGLEAVNVVLNLAEQAEDEDELCDSSTDKDFEFAKPGLVIMKKKPGLDSESVAGSELESTYTYTGDLSLNTYPSLSSLSKYPSMTSLSRFPSPSNLSKFPSTSSLSSISCDDSVISFGLNDAEGQKIDADLELFDLVDGNQFGNGTPAEEANFPKREILENGGNEENIFDNVESCQVSSRANNSTDFLKSATIDLKIDGTLKNTGIDGHNTGQPIHDGMIAGPISDRTNRSDHKKVVGKKLTLSQLQGKSFKKMHEELKRRTQALP